MKKTIGLLILIFFIKCNKENSINLYKGEYYGEKIILTSYEEYDSIFHQLVDKHKYDTLICKMQIMPKEDKLDIKEFDGNNNLINYWHGFEVNNIGELAYFGLDTSGYGNITSNTFSCAITFINPIQPDTLYYTSDTLFYTYHFNTLRQ